MANYPYTTVPGKISKLFEKIGETGIPSEATQRWLQSIGFKSSNDRTLLPILKFIGFIDSSNTPTDQWKKFRGAHGGKVLAECIRKAYAELFSTYQNAWERDRTELESFFSTHSSVGKRTVGKTVSTFLELCKLADFGDTKAPVKPAVGAEEAESKADSTESMTVASKPYKGYTININIQLTLPETTDEKIYEAFFSAMKKHLLEGNS